MVGKNAAQHIKTEAHQRHRGAQGDGNAEQVHRLELGQEMLRNAQQHGRQHGRQDADETVRALQGFRRGRRGRRFRPLVQEFAQLPHQQPAQGQAGEDDQRLPQDGRLAEIVDKISDQVEQRGFIHGGCGPEGGAKVVRMGSDPMPPGGLAALKAATAGCSGGP